MIKNLIKKGLEFLLDHHASQNQFWRLSSMLFPNWNGASKKISGQHIQWIWQGLLNSQIISASPQRIWPFWVYKQLDPKSPTYSNPGFPIGFINCTARNWTNLSLPSTNDTVLIDPQGLITPKLGSWSIDCWLEQNKTLISTAFLNDIKQHMVNDAPVIQTHFNHKAIEITTEAFIQDCSQEGVIFHKTILKNTSAEPQSFTYYIAIRPYNPEGLCAIDEITYLTPQAFIIDYQLGIVLDQQPDNVVCLTYRDGDSSEHTHDFEMILQAKCKDHMASGFAAYQLLLKPNQTQTLTYKIPSLQTKKLRGNFNRPLQNAHQKKLLARIETLQNYDYDTEKARRIAAYKETVTAWGMIETPDPVINQNFKLNLMYLINSLNTINTATQSEALFSSIRATNHLGPTEAAEAIIKTWPEVNNQSPIQIARHLIALETVFMATNSTAFFQQKSQYIAAQGNRLLSEIRNAQVPKNISWPLAGLRSAITLLSALGKEATTTTWKSEYTKQIDLQLKQWQAALASNYQATPSPNQMMSFLNNVYPLNQITASDPTINSAYAQLQKSSLIDGIFFNYGEQMGYPVVSNITLAQIYNHQKNPQAFVILDWLMRTAAATGGWPEAIHPISLGGSTGSGHLLSASAEFLLLIKNMLVQETEDTLILLPCIPTDWLPKTDQTLQINNLKTRFGTLSLNLQPNGEKKYILEIKTTYTNTPDTITCSMPTTMASVRVENTTTVVNNTTVNLPVTCKKVSIYLE